MITFSGIEQLEQESVALFKTDIGLFKINEVNLGRRIMDLRKFRIYIDINVLEEEKALRALEKEKYIK